MKKLIAALALSALALTACGSEEPPSEPYVETQDVEYAEDEFIKMYDERVIENGRSDFTSDVVGRDVVLDTARAVCGIFDVSGVNDDSINRIIVVVEYNGMPSEAWAPLVAGATFYICPEHYPSLKDWNNR